MPSMSFQEKSAWGTLASLLVIGALYFSSVINLWRAEQLHMASLFGLAVGFTVLLTVVLVGFHLIVAAISGGRAADEDERDRLIAWRAGHISGIVLGVAVVSVVFMIIGGGMVGDPLWQAPVIIANGLMAAVFLSTVVELALTVWFHRRGI
ncbi:MAG: hypothetical protein HND55_15375 [Pseudomonadota bacterium]|nr:MAG: hypothetical protein HND55_00045 [Pseudomonadota bacterium]QKK03912.1 MAG: hypothetical protein HND55_15375 [Pseudomonadota bacterium]